MTKKKKIQLQKITMPKLTEEERVLIAENLDSPLVKLLATKIIPGRATQLALTCVSAAQTDQDLWYYKGRVAEADWLPNYLNKMAEGTDSAEYNANTDLEGEIDASDDLPA